MRLLGLMLYATHEWQHRGRTRPAYVSALVSDDTAVGVRIQELALRAGAGQSVVESRDEGRQRVSSSSRQCQQLSSSNCTAASLQQLTQPQQGL